MKEIKLKRYKNVIYELYCLSTDTYYIGQTIKPLNDRMSKHFSDAKSGRKQPLYQDIRIYGRENFSYKELETVKDKYDLDEREKYWIDKYLNLNRKVYNRELGGKKNYKISSSVSIEMSRAKGVKPFMIFDYYKKYYGTFNTISEAENIFGITGIGHMLNKLQAHCSKYIAIFENEYSDEILIQMVSKLIIDKNGNIRTYVNLAGKNNPMYGKVNPRAKAVIQYNLNGDITNTYISILDAARSVDGSKDGIKYHIQHDTKDYKGFKWGYLNQTKPTGNK